MAKLPVIFEPSGRHVRVQFNGQFIANSQRVMLLRDSAYDIHYAFPEADVDSSALSNEGNAKPSKYKGTQYLFDVHVGDRRAENAAWAYREEPATDARPDLRGYLFFKWDAMDAWFEEDEQVIGHARDPYHRVDAIRSQRHIRVEVDGVTVAESRRPYLVFETGLPTRYYLPRADVHWQYLTPTDTHTLCPYKGIASYWTITVNGNSYPDHAWAYPEPRTDVGPIGDTVAFYNEKLDIYVDGVLEDRPRTVFS